MNTNSPQKIVVVVLLNRLYEWSQNFITRELVELKRQGVEVRIGARKIVERDDLTDEEISFEKNFILIPENPFKPLSLWQHIKFKIKHPVYYFRAWGHFFTFGHKRLSKIGRSLVCLFRAVSIAEVFIEKKIELIHAHFMTAPAETALYISVLTGIPFGCTAHAMDIYQDNSGLQKKVQRAVYVITCTETNARFLRKQKSACSAKIFKIYHGIRLFNQRNTAHPSCKPFTFLAVGRFTPKKGFIYLLEACKILKENDLKFKCRIVGQGPLEEDLKNQVEQKKITDMVEIQGYVPPNKMDEIYESSDVLVMPSIVQKNGDRDGLPNVCLEAMAHGLPIIASRISGIPEGVIDGVNGKLVPPADVTALGQAMAFFLTANNLNQMQKAAYRVVGEKFNLEKNVNQLKSIMERFHKL